MTEWRRTRGWWCLTAAAFLAAGCGQPEEPAAEAERYDVLIVNGTVYDGTAAAPRRGAIGISGTRIVAMDAPADASAGVVIDAAGLAVMPGFIDPHTHAGDDLGSDTGRMNANYLAQGVTTVFVGNDGNGVPGLAATLDAWRGQGVGTNVAFYAGHNDIREQAMGLENRPPTAAELGRMLALVDEQMRAGALGLSTGLYYTPGSFAATDEVVELAGVAARYGGVYDTHLRDESSYSIGLLGAVEEAITVGEEAGIPVHIAHLKALGRDVWGQSGDVIALVDAARTRGVDVTADQYPYRASGTRFAAALIPAWVRADSEDAMLERLADPDLEARIREQMAANLGRRGGAGSLLVTAGDSPWRGMTLEDIAAEMQLDPLAAAIEVVRAGDPSIASFNMEAEDIRALAIQEWVMTGSDGSAGHPRKYGTYPTVYREMVVDQGLFPVERFVHRSAGAVADFFGLCDRGYLREGRRADVIVVDLDRYRPVADFENPDALATGVVYAFVNGRPAIRGGELTDMLAGEVIDRQRLDCPIE